MQAKGVGGWAMALPAHIVFAVSSRTLAMCALCDERFQPRDVVCTVDTEFVGSEVCRNARRVNDWLAYTAWRLGGG